MFLLLIASAILRGVTGAPFVDENSINSEKGGNMVNIEVFGESKCPDTTRFLRNHLLNLWKNFGNSGRLNISYHPYGITRNGGCVPTGDGDYKCGCQHGEGECILNALQACIINELPNSADHLETVICIQSKRDLQFALNQCVDNSSFSHPPLDSKELEKCATSAEGHILQYEQGQIQATRAVGLHWVPWIVINGERIKRAEGHIWEELCNNFFKPKPDECNRKLY